MNHKNKKMFEADYLKVIYYSLEFKQPMKHNIEKRKMKLLVKLMITFKGHYFSSRLPIQFNPYPGCRQMHNGDFNC